MTDADFTFEDVTFFGFSQEVQTHRLAVEGEKLWKLLFERNKDFGGWYVEIVGLMGSGKTSLMFEMAKTIFNKFPDEIVFWREPIMTPIQATKLNDDFEIFCERKYPIKICELGKNVKPKPTDRFKIRCFNSYSQLLDMVRPGQLNIIFFKDLYKWIELMFKLRFNTSFQTLFLDEAEDVIPSRCQKKAYWMNEKFATHIKQIRKSNVNCIMATQQPSDIDWRIRSKAMMHIYLKGSRGDSESPVWKSMIQSLTTGEAVIDLGFSVFGKITFQAYKPREPFYCVFPTDSSGRILSGLP